MTRRLKFYDAEDARHPLCNSVGVYLDREAAEEAVEWLEPGTRVEWLKRGSRTSWAYGEGLILFAESSTWLTLAHEIAHVIQYRQRGSSAHDADLSVKVAGVVALLEAWDYPAASAQRQAELFTLRDLAQRFPTLEFACPRGLKHTLERPPASRAARSSTRTKRGVITRSTRSGSVRSTTRKTGAASSERHTR